MSSKAYNISKAFILCMITFFSAQGLAQTDDAMRGIKTVVIDPGHGGSDPGIQVAPATGETPELFEKQLALYLARMLHALT